MFLLLHVAVMLALTILYYFFMKSQAQLQPNIQHKYPTVSKKVIITQLNPMTLDPTKTGDMLSRLEHTKEIRQELDRKEDEARELKKWLTENENAPPSERQDRQKQLLAALQSINDLVCQLKPSVYTLR